MTNMSSTDSKAKTYVRRTGYNGSGFAFYFVRCQDRKSFKQCVATASKGQRVPNIADIDGFTTCAREEVMRGVIEQSAPIAPKSIGDFIVETHMIVKADATDKAGERSTWYHEIGHAVDFCAQHMAIVRRDHGVKAEGQCSDEETRALLSEFLMSSLDSFLEDGEHASSGLLTAMPWANVHKADLAKTVKVEVKHV
jgi:hypothetical protein